MATSPVELTRLESDALAAFEHMLRVNGVDVTDWLCPMLGDGDDWREYAARCRDQITKQGWLPQGSLFRRGQESPLTAMQRYVCRAAQHAALSVANRLDEKVREEARAEAERTGDYESLAED